MSDEGSQVPSERRAQDRADGRGAVGVDLLVSPAELEALSLTADRGGIVIGSDVHGGALALNLVRPTPTRLVLLGGLYLARQVVLRAAATGASVVIATGRPAAWAPLLRATASPAPQRWRSSPVPVQLRGLQPAALPHPSEEHPLLVVHDGSAVPQELYPPNGSWQTAAYVLPYLHPQAARTATGADVALVQRLPVGQAQLAGRMWRLHPAQSHQLASLTDDGVVAVGDGLWLPLRLVTTGLESALLGPVRRGD